jgi:hypothetical protein
MLRRIAMNPFVRSSSVVLLSMSIHAFAQAQSPQNSLQFASSTEPHAEVLRKVVLRNLPANLAFEYSQNWGHQAQVPSIQGIKPIHVLRNHGSWHRMKVVAQNLPHALRLRLEDLQFPAQDRMTARLAMTIPAIVEFEQQTWQNGVEVYSSRGRARMQLLANFILEGESQGSEQKYVVKMGRPRCISDEFVAENINGMGGDLARLAGNKLKSEFRRWQATLEQDVLKKTRAAVAQAVDATETRLCLAGLNREMYAQRLEAQAALMQASTRYSVPEAPKLAVSSALTTPAVIWIDSISFQIELGPMPERDRKTPTPNTTPHETPLAHPAPVYYSTPVAHSASTSHTSHSSSHTSQPEPARKR